MRRHHLDSVVAGAALLRNLIEPFFQLVFRVADYDLWRCLGLAHVRQVCIRTHHHVVVVRRRVTETLIRRLVEQL
jgi:hypothetical protein